MSLVRLTPTTDVDAERFGARAVRLRDLCRAGVPMPDTVLIEVDMVQRLATGAHRCADQIFEAFGGDAIVAVRSSAREANLGGAKAVLHVGLTRRWLDQLPAAPERDIAIARFHDFVQFHAVHVARLDPDAFIGLSSPADDPERRLAGILAAFERQSGAPFPDNATEQLDAVLRSMARAWDATTARILRRARGAHDDVGMGLVIQRMSGLGEPGPCGRGVVRDINADTGGRGIEGTYSAARLAEQEIAINACRFADQFPEPHAALSDCLTTLRRAFKQAVEVEFVIENGTVRILDYGPAARSVRAAIASTVTLVADEVLSPVEALRRIEPIHLLEMLHPRVDRDGDLPVLASGTPASPGAATGAIVFSAGAAARYAARQEPCILVRVETGPQDIRGMHSADGVLTGRGGMTSHAAVIARGLGVPCVAGASSMTFNDGCVLFADGTRLCEGDRITLDGTAGDILPSSANLVRPQPDAHLQTLLGWADEVRDIGVRANADTPFEAQLAHDFNADGIGLCRTEHMFHEETRLTALREIIFADCRELRAAALERLLPMQRTDFEKIFAIMDKAPVCIRLFDPPLHEFLPLEHEDLHQLADALDMPIASVSARADELREFNPMLGLRGVRLGITMPEIYDMQARAVFEATANVIASGIGVTPEIMIPLVSANREVQIVKERIEREADRVRAASGIDFDCVIGAMIETPRAALRAGDLAGNAQFLSFGTNDLTQMTYGISRDDAEKFIHDYVREEVFPSDPFSTLDCTGVGELLHIAAQRGRNTNANLTLSICGEHGGDPRSIAFFRDIGFDYVSCSPFRVPIARLAAARLALDAPPHNAR